MTPDDRQARTEIDDDTPNTPYENGHSDDVTDTRPEWARSPGTDRTAATGSAGATPPGSRTRDPLTLSLVAMIGVLIAVVSFLSGMILEREVVSDAGQGATTIDGRRIEAVAGLIEDEYYYQGAETSQEELREDMEQGALQGLTANLEDPYTTYLPPAQAAPLNDQLDGEYEGIGVRIQVIEGQLVVVQPEPGSPAERAGILPGDVLLAADGTSLTGEALEAAGELIRGPEGTTVTLTIERPGLETPFTLDVVRARLEDEVVIYSFDQATGVATIRVTIFSDTTTSQFDRAMRRVEEDGATGIVLDLRGNSGGWVTAAQQMVGYFLDASAGPALLEDVGRVADGGELVPLPILNPEGGITDLPVVVLIDGGTASAAEIVAGALADYDRATLVGQRSFGKGSVQRVHNFADGASLRVTIAEWLTPDGSRITGSGISPAYVVGLEGAPPGTDPQREAAVGLLVGERWANADLGW